MVLKYLRLTSVETKYYSRVTAANIDNKYAIMK